MTKGKVTTEREYGRPSQKLATQAWYEEACHIVLLLVFELEKGLSVNRDKDSHEKLPSSSDVGFLPV